MNLSAPDRVPAEALRGFYSSIRGWSTTLCRTLEPEDFVVQSMPDVSPTKWHLAHTTWFFETFILKQHLPQYRVFHPGYDFLFNSYYYTVGEMHLRPERGLLTRPTVREVMAYREHVDEHVERLLAQQPENERLAFLIELGLHHEQQHQELMLMDIKHVLACNPLYPAARDIDWPPHEGARAMRFVEQPGGLREIGHHGNGFCFDKETPRHRVFVNAHALGSRPVTNGEYSEFIRDGGYRQCALWLSDGWTTVQQESWERPLYWSEGLEQEFTLGGLVELDTEAPVTHVSYFEADAYARWAGARLPTEAEWEIAASQEPVNGNFVEKEVWHPASTPATSGPEFAQIYGDVWEWTRSPYSPYPGFEPLEGPLGEYNGKFLCNQLVLRGGSCVTPESHIRATYRNFFYPHQRWQFSGIRLARDS